MARRNNQARVGAPTLEEELEIEDTPEPVGTPSLSFVVPTDLVELPSRGSAYPKDHPLHGKTSIEVRFMTAKEEDILTSRTLLEKGVALDRLVQSIILDEKIHVKTLLVGDKNAILINARKNGYGEQYSTTIDCPECETSQEKTYDLSTTTVLGPATAKALKAARIKKTADYTFLVELPVSNVQIEFQLLTSKDEGILLAATEHRRKRKLPERTVTDQLKLMVVGANGETDKNLLNQFVETLTLKDSRTLREAYELVTPGVEMKEVFVCGDCGHEDEINFPVTTDFFWPQ